jgi:hypothetical protein
MNDITSELACNIKFFADDTSLFIIIDDSNYIEASEILSTDLSRIHNWSRDWAIKFNPNKTESVLFTFDLNYVSFSKLPFNNNETNFQIVQIVLLISLSIVLTLYIILELPLFDCIIIINSVVAVALYEERIYIGLSCYPILFSTFMNKICLN